MELLMSSIAIAMCVSQLVINREQNRCMIIWMMIYWWLVQMIFGTWLSHESTDFWVKMQMALSESSSIVICLVSAPTIQFLIRKFLCSYVCVHVCQGQLKMYWVVLGWLAFNSFNRIVHVWKIEYHALHSKISGISMVKTIEARGNISSGYFFPSPPLINCMVLCSNWPWNLQVFLCEMKCSIWYILIYSNVYNGMSKAESNQNLFVSFLTNELIYCVTTNIFLVEVTKGKSAVFFHFPMYKYRLIFIKLSMNECLIFFILKDWSSISW